jgi:hypothetical protein
MARWFGNDCGIRTDAGSLEDGAVDPQPGPARLASVITRLGGWMRPVVGVFRRNRRAWESELSVNGKKGRWTALDRGRIERCRRMVETADKALTQAQALECNRYSLAGEAIRQGAALMGWLGIGAWGGIVAISAAWQARLPDGLVAGAAMEATRSAVSLSDQRDQFSMMIAAGAVAAAYGLYRIWRQLQRLGVDRASAGSSSFSDQ